jgi:hypothetical protein
MGNPFDARCPALLVVLFVLTPLAEAAFVRANCRGIQEFSATEPRVSCEESSVLSDDDQRVMLGHTRAAASLAEARLSASAAGGQIRDVGWNGGEAGALLKDRLIITGTWDGYVVVTVRLCVAYKFAGFGESRIDATLRTASADGVSGGNQARVSLRHRGFAGTSLADVESRGAFTIPQQGPRAPESTFELTVTERVHRSRPAIDLRADIAAIALPNLEALEPVLASFGQTVAWIAVSLPARLAFSSESGVFPSASCPPGGRARSEPGAARFSGIMKTGSMGKRNALRSHRGGYRAVARSDRRHQFGMDG